MATVRIAATSLLTTVAETAETFTSLISSVHTGAKMINDYTTNARERQLMDIKLSKVGFEENLKATKALEITASRQRLQDYIGTDTVRAEEINAIMAKFDEVLA